MKNKNIAINTNKVLLHPGVYCIFTSPYELYIHVNPPKTDPISYMNIDNLITRKLFDIFKPLMTIPTHIFLNKIVYFIIENHKHCSAPMHIKIHICPNSSTTILAWDYGKGFSMPIERAFLDHESNYISTNRAKSPGLGLSSLLDKMNAYHNFIKVITRNYLSGYQEFQKIITWDTSNDDISNIPLKTLKQQQSILKKLEKNKSGSVFLIHMQNESFR